MTSPSVAPTSTDARPARPSRTDDPGWWRRAVFYQVYPRSFADSNGDGNGDLPGITARLDYLAALGVDAIWISPFFTSPMVDNGYDVSDPCDVDPMFGTLADFDDLVSAAHAHGIKVTVDLVPNHFSDQHPWFQAALAAAPGSPERDRFIFRDGKGADGAEPPNNWPSTFGGSAWQRVPDGQWYLHIFAAEQPDLNWDNPDVVAEFGRIIRFWLDRGADGFRMDVAHGMAKPDGLPDMPVIPAPNTQVPDDLRFDQPKVHGYLRSMRAVIDEYPGAMVVGEVWVDSGERRAKYVRPDELHLSFNFELERAPWDAAEFRTAIDEGMAALAEVKAPNSWVLSNHDVVREVTRYGDGALGLARARAAALVALALPGAVYLYNGEELGLPNADVPDADRQDPTFARTNGADKGRDGERIPLPWSGSVPPFGFTSGTPWLPMPADWAGRTVADQEADPTSTLSVIRSALALRHSSAALRSTDFNWIESPEGSLAFQRGELAVVANMTDQPAPLPVGEVVLASGPLSDEGVLPADTAVWLRTG